MSGSGRDSFTPPASGVPFDNDTNGFVADEVQAAIEEVDNKVNTSASPGFGFGKGGNLPAGTYLQCEGVPSNICGRYVYINSAVVTRVFVAVQSVGTFDVQVYSHNGNEVNLTSLGVVNIVASSGGEFTVNWPVPTGKQLAMRIVNGSAKNCVGGLELQGTN